MRWNYFLKEIRKLHTNVTLKESNEGCQVEISTVKITKMTSVVAFLISAHSRFAHVSRYIPYLITSYFFPGGSHLNAHTWHGPALGCQGHIQRLLLVEALLHHSMMFEDV